MKLSIIIPSYKTEILTLKSLFFCTVPYHLIVSREHGLGYARNYGARQVEHGLMVFLDDDLILRRDSWDRILSIKEGQFGMLHIKGRCSSRIVAIHTKDFWELEGFDEAIRYTGEDIDFFLRARKQLEYCPIQECLVTHPYHIERWRNPLLCIKMHFQQAYLVVKHGFDYFQFWGGLRRYIMQLLKKPRTNFPTVIGFFYYLWKKR